MYPRKDLFLLPANTLRIPSSPFECCAKTGTDPFAVSLHVSEHSRPECLLHNVACVQSMKELPHL